MTQGIWINSNRPKTKKAVKEHFGLINETAKLVDQYKKDPKDDPQIAEVLSNSIGELHDLLRAVSLEATSMFGDEPHGSLFYLTGNAATVQRLKSRGVTIVGPDPYNSRKWYASIKLKEDGTFVVS